MPRTPPGLKSPGSSADVRGCTRLQSIQKQLLEFRLEFQSHARDPIRTSTLQKHSQPQHYPSNSLFDSCSRWHRISRALNGALQPNIARHDHCDAADQAMGFSSFAPSRVRPATMPVRCILWSRSTTFDSSDSLIDQPTIFLTPKAAPDGLGSLSREQVDHDCEKQPALERWNVRQISHPCLIGFFSIEFPLELILGNRVGVLGVSGFLFYCAFAFALEPKFTHDACDSRTTAWFVLFLIPKRTLRAGSPRAGQHEREDYRKFFGCSRGLF